MRETENNTKRGGLDVVRTIILIAAFAVLIYSGYQLFTIFHGYAAADNEYEDIQKEFTRPVAKPEGLTPTPEPESGTEEGPTRLIEDAEPPLEAVQHHAKRVHALFAEAVEVYLKTSATLRNFQTLIRSSTDTI